MRVRDGVETCRWASESSGESGKAGTLPTTLSPLAVYGAKRELKEGFVNAAAQLDS